MSSSALMVADAPADIPNFAWVESDWLARGRQPPLTADAYQALRQFGFTTVLSLRARAEYLDQPDRRYEAADERALCAAVGLRFLHAPCADFQAPHPSEVVRALSLLQAEAAAGRRVYLHCLAGVGRTGVVSAAWLLSRGASGAAALAHYVAFCEEVHARRAAQRERVEFFQSIGMGRQLWVVGALARCFDQNDPLPPLPVAPERPAAGRGWERRFRAQWARRRATSDG